MSKKTGIAFLVMLIVVVALVAGGVIAFKKAENTPLPASVARTDKPGTESGAEGKVVEEVAVESVEAVAGAPVADIAEEIIAEPVADAVEDAAEEKTVEAPPAESSAPQRRPVRNVTEGLGGMMPMMGRNNGALPTKEEAVEAARDILAGYRSASPEEKQQMVMGIVMVQSIISGFSQNAGMLLQQMSPEQREQIVGSAATSLELIDAMQEELAAGATPEEAQLFGSLFQSLRNVNEALSNAAQTQF